MQLPSIASGPGVLANNFASSPSAWYSRQKTRMNSSEFSVGIAKPPMGIPFWRITPERACGFRFDDTLAMPRFVTGSSGIIQAQWDLVALSDASTRSLHVKPPLARKASGGIMNF